jgi:hypothetical protein
MIISVYCIVIFCLSSLLITYWYQYIQPPASFLATMEEYVSNAPLASTVQRNQVCKHYKFYDILFQYNVFLES